MNYVYYISFIISILFLLGLIIFNNKLLMLLFALRFLVFSVCGLSLNVIFPINNEWNVVYVFLSLLFSYVITKKTYKFIYNSFSISDKLRHDKFVDLVGNICISETKITTVGGAATLVENKKIIPVKSYYKTIDKGERMLITDYSAEEEVYIVDHYPI